MNRLIRFLLVTLACLVAFPAMAQSNQAVITATGTLITPLSWGSVTSIAFGKMAKPAASQSPVTFILHSGTAATSGTGDWVTDGTRAVGACTLNGEDTYAVTLSVSNYTGPTGVTPSDATVSCASPTVSNVAADSASFSMAAATAALTFGATLTVTSAASTGSIATTSFTVTAAYN